jgi:hypothetical protein
MSFVVYSGVRANIGLDKDVLKTGRAPVSPSVILKN